MTQITTENIRPFVRCVGIGQYLRQPTPYRAYDHRFIGILSGTGELTLGGEHIATVPGDAFIIPPGAEYRVLSEKDQRIIVVNFDWTPECSAISATVPSVNSALFCEENIIAPADFSTLFGTAKNVRLVFPESTQDLFQRLYAAYMAEDEDTEWKQLQLSALMLCILTCGVRHSDAAAHERGAAELLYAYILSNYDRPLSVADAAEHFHYSTSHVSKMLRRRYSMSFKQIVIDCRLKRALWLLENTALSCEEIAVQVGFYNGQHLSRAFRAKYGTTPGKYR